MGRRSLTQTDLASATGLSQAKVSKTIWNDVGSLTLDQLEAVCLALGVQPSDVIESAERTALTSQHVITAPYLTAQDGYDLAAKKARKLHPGEEEGVEYYE